ncbi:hypothetical protein H4R20_002338 [Coemansia guatemalensis]|uniref:J domain-containing protein n=1 Tax=Coemansia guatemalensis TaxID=2761395 RepID=A0A9W8HVM9_9FUNG|nr:hypothetical protein H4R20_002338 [Coemansia guatemalensis]
MSNSDGASERTLNADGRASTDTTELYNLLGVEKCATEAELKRAYRRLALQHHPDRNRGNTGSAEEFVRIQYAYDVLSDERMRRIYNRYGAIGVQMAGRVGSEVLDPLISGMLSMFAYASAASTLLLIAFFALLARRIDHAHSWPFTVIFMPIWTIDVVLLAVLGFIWVRGTVSRHFSSRQNTEDSASESEFSLYDDEEETNVDDHQPQTGNTGYGYNATASSNVSGQGLGAHTDDIQTSQATDATPLLNPERGNSGEGQETSRHGRRRGLNAQQRRLRGLRKRIETRFAALATVVAEIYLLLIIAFEVTLALWLDGHIDWTALQVAMFWFGIDAFHFVILTLQLVVAVLRIRERALAVDAENQHSSITGQLRPSVIKQTIVLAADTYWWLAIRVALVVLVAGKLDGPLASWSWVLIFAPAYLPAIRWALTLYFLRQQLQRMGRDDAESLQNQNKIVLGSAIAFGIMSTFMYSFLALLIWKLAQPSAIRLALVLIPVFVALSLACCCCTCCGFCLTFGIESALENEESAGQPGNTTNAAPVPAGRRIE